MGLFKVPNLLLIITIVADGANSQGVPRDPATIARILQQSIRSAANEMQSEEASSRQNSPSGSTATSTGTRENAEKGSYMWHHSQFSVGFNPNRVRSLSKNSLLSTLAQQNFDRLTNSPPGTLVKDPRLYDQFKSQISQYCTVDSPKHRCDQNARYRTPDGICNNIKHPYWGSSFRPFKRYLPPEYEDVYDAPRTRSVKGGPLPSARKVSNIVHKQGRCCKANSQQTVIFMAFGQFRDHDMTSTPVCRGPNDEMLKCCPFDSPNLPKCCFSIRIPRGDPKNMTCMNFVRSSPATETCLAGPREQINQLTAYLDASSVYGSEQLEQNSLRTFTGGLLKTGVGNILPRNNASDVCILDRPNDFCFDAGDKRHTEIASLTPLHIVFVRYHNNIAATLKRKNPSWNDEILFQEARKVVSAVLQHITYNEYLPIVLGPKVISNLKPSPSGFRNVYDPHEDATIANSFATAVFRFGHSEIPSRIKRLDRYSRVVANVPLHTQFDRPTFMHVKNGVEDTLRWEITDRQNGEDRRIDDSVRENLFIDTRKHALDLAALNIQRGRDHGLPPYVSWRKWCKLSPVFHFGGGDLGLVDHDSDARRRLKRAYKHTGDIDLFPGGLSETNLPGALVGPTFACIMSKQFLQLRNGDRFYYENNNAITGFTIRQLNEIKKISLSSVFCSTVNLGYVQPNVFQTAHAKTNPYVYCKDLPQINFDFWQTSGYQSQPRRYDERPGVEIPRNRKPWAHRVQMRRNNYRRRQNNRNGRNRERKNNSRKRNRQRIREPGYLQDVVSRMHKRNNLG